LRHRFCIVGRARRRDHHLRAGKQRRQVVHQQRGVCGSSRSM
jgi:hypothetical protein